MKLSDLAFACYIYGRISDYDRSYEELLRATQPTLDFHSSQHMAALLAWLNSWGCRQFAKAYHAAAARKLGEWWDKAGCMLSGKNKELLSLTDEDIERAAYAYGRLADTSASMRQAQNGSSIRVTVGPTGASKILFAWRPAAFLPWDDPIRDAGGYDGSSRAYARFLRLGRERLRQLEQQCRQAGFEVADLPKMIGRERSTLVKLLDEYWWVTITRKWVPPDDKILKQWAAWS